MPATLDENIAAYDAMRSCLETECHGKWVVFYDKEFIRSYDEFEDAAAETVKRYGRGPYLIRQVGVRRVLRVPSFW